MIENFRAVRFYTQEAATARPIVDSTNQLNEASHVYSAKNLYFQPCKLPHPSPERIPRIPTGQGLGRDRTERRDVAYMAAEVRQ
jgi:hypothetical protein